MFELIGKVNENQAKFSGQKEQYRIRLAGVDRVKSIYCLLADCKNRISKIRSLVFEYIGKVNLYGESWIYYLYVLFMPEIYEHIFENTIFKFENTIFKFEFWQIHAKV